MKPPRTTHQQKGVHVVKGKPIFIEKDKLKEARSKLSSHLSQHVPEKPYEGPLECVVKWCFLTQSKKLHGKYKITRPDCHNLNKLLFDCMTDLGYWVDDSHVCREIIEKFWVVEKPGIFISIKELK